MTFDTCRDDVTAGEPPGRLDYRLTDAGDGVPELVVTISGLTGETARSAARDTPLIDSDLKTWLETGRALREPS